MAPSQLLSSAGIPSNLVASCIFLLTLVFLSGSIVLGMRPLSELSGADKATVAQAALQRATIFRTRNGAERRLLANSFVAATDALGLANTLVGANSLLTVDASSVVYTGATSASGIFQLDASHALNSEYGISSGVVLTCGSGELSIATDNDIENSSTSNNVPGDSLLDLINNGVTNDASVLDFKGTAQGNGQLTFQYVFGSEEYLEYVGSFNDVFALFVKVGNGDFTPSDNVALASDGKAVSIDNVNPNSNAAQYVDNPAVDGTHAIAYDGYTKLLTTAPISVSTGDIVHIRLAIADALDTALDSVVYVVGKSIVIAPTPGPTTLTPAPTTLAPTTTPAPTTPAPTTPPPTISKCSDLCNTASSAPNRCCNSEGSLGICCPGLCGLSTPNSDGTTNPTCLGGGGATQAPTTSAPTTPAPTTSAPTTPAPTTPAPSTTPASTTSAPTATPGPTTSAPTTPAPTTPAPTTAPTPTPTGALQSCTSDFCSPYGPLPNKCCDAFGVTMRCCPGQCGPNIVNDGVSTPTCM